MKSGIPPDLLLEAYASGIFPMGMPDGEIRWYSPDPRGILPLEEFHTPHGLKRILRKRSWDVRIDTAFQEVMQACASREETWITEVIAESYTLLFESGHAHSVEVWQDDKLVGGLYGVSIGGAFFGESMFHRVTNASKVALWHLVEILKKGGFTLLDSQWTTPHLEQFGAREIPRSDYLEKLAAAITLKTTFSKPLNFL
ncbi:MAG: leucyl/phenylalanyl-tRNA--protein transferase [Chthoniobacterales bacterium]|nr:leucyl/phenylalanyl-tRNA--protein transferase [Chthoniobacterales bacterium]